MGEGGWTKSDLGCGEGLTGRGRGGDNWAPYKVRYSGPSIIYGRGNLELMGEVQTGDIFFLPSDNYINFKEKTTFISNTQIYLQKQQKLKLTYVY